MFKQLSPGKLLLGSVVLLLIIVFVGAQFFKASVAKTREAELRAHSYQQLKAELPTLMQTLVDNLKTPETVDLLNQLKSFPANLAKIEGDYAAAKKAGANAEDLAKIVDQYVDAVVGVNKTIQKLLGKINHEMAAIEQTVGIMAYIAPDQYKTDEVEIEKIIKPAVDVMETVNGALEPMTALAIEASQQLQEREDKGEKITKDIELEEIKKAASKVLEEKSKS